MLLSDEPEDSMVIATPFHKSKHFYYNQKINCLRAEGKFTIGQQEYLFTKIQQQLFLTGDGSMDL